MIPSRRCDLHMHTVCSDGTVTPTELVALAKEASLSCIALTDHDTLEGIEEAQKAGRDQGIEVISGVEISVQCKHGTLHILGYFVDPHSEVLNKGLLEVQEARKQRNPKIIERLQSLGIDITFDEVERVSGGGQVGRPHFAKVLIEKGYAKDNQAVFDTYLGKGKPAYIDKRTLSSKEAIRMINAAGGVAVIAHPKLLNLDATPDVLRSEVKRLKDEGIGGIEVFSSCQSAKEAARYQALARDLDLIATGGSDFHGGNKPNVRLGRMGKGAFIEYETIDKMKKIILDRKLK